MSRDEDNRQYLRNVSCFHDLDDDTLGAVADLLEDETYSNGEIICHEGKRCERVILIHTGTVSVRRVSEEGEDEEVERLGPGDVSGEICLFGEMVRGVTLVADGDVGVSVLRYSRLAPLLERNCTLNRALLACITRHLRSETSVVHRLFGHQNEKRLRIAFFDNKPYMEQAFAAANEETGYDLRWYEARLSRRTASLAAGCEVVCAFVNDDLSAPVIRELAGLGVGMIALRCAGYNNVDLDACREHGITVARVPAYSPHAVAEHTVALVLALNRKVHRAYNRVREGNFSRNGLVGFDLYGRTVGVVGAGHIGACLLEILHGFGCRLLAHDKRPVPHLTENLGVEFVDLDRLFTESDIISLHVPLFPETHHMIDADAIAKMKRGVMLINTSRGALVDADALVDGLRNGAIGSAGLDVYEEESEYFFEDRSEEVLTDDTLARLISFNNVVITSHQAFLTGDALGNIAETTFANIREYESGKRGGDLANAVTAG